MYAVQSLTAASVFVLSIGGGMALGLATGEQPSETARAGDSSSHRRVDDDARPGGKPQDKPNGNRGRSEDKRGASPSAYGQVLGDWKECVADAGSAADCGPRPRPEGKARGWDKNGLADGTKPGRGVGRNR